MSDAPSSKPAHIEVPIEWVMAYQPIAGVWPSCRYTYLVYIDVPGEFGIRAVRVSVAPYVFSRAPHVLCLPSIELSDSELRHRPLVDLHVTAKLRYDGQGVIAKS
jgi:hypothetical protein